MENDPVTSMRRGGDAEWIAQNPELDAALDASIRAPVVSKRFDEQVWTLIRAAQGEALAKRKVVRVALGPSWWLDTLNVIAIAATVATVVIALVAVRARPLAEAISFSLALVDQLSDSVRLGVVVASAVGFSIGLFYALVARAMHDDLL